MDDLTRALLLSWSFRLDVMLSLIILASLQILGWRRLRRRGGRRFANGWRLASYLSGLVLLGIALQSPLDVLGNQLFLVHMLQHMVIMMFAAPLLVLANPFATFLWALPGQWRKKVGGWFQPNHPLYRTLATLTGPGVVWMIFVGVYIGWHDPNAYNLALRNEFVHDIEHVTFFAVSMLFWWRVIGAGPQIGKRMSLLMRAAFAVSAVPPNMLVGVAIAFADQPIYTYYTGVPRLYGISVMDDQTWSGLIMWIPGSMMFILAAIVLIGVLLNSDKRPIPADSTGAPAKKASADLENRIAQAKWRQAQRLRSGEAL